MRSIKLIIVLFLLSVSAYSNDLNDTIKVVINLKQVDSLGLKINVYPPSVLDGSVSYQFPKSIPGIYEYLNSCQPLIQLKQNEVEIDCVDNSFQIDCELAQSSFTYFAKSTVNKFKGISAEDTYYLKDSIYILNWHYLLGFFQNETEKPYKIEIIKNAKLFGTGSLSKSVLNDTTDVYIANNYKDLIHNPVLYSVPDTTSFRIGETNFTISCAGNDSLLDSKKIKDLIIAPLTKIINKSVFKHKEYSFLYYSEYSLTLPYLTGLEHPNSTLICYHSAFLENNILVSSSIHEFIHAIYAPLRIRSEVIDEFDFRNPKCDELLWFYEGITEYLAIKTLVNSGFFKTNDFFEELNESIKCYKNINLSKVSSNIYKKKEQKLFDNFYTKGSLFAMQLDIELIRRSNGKTDLFDVMQKLQGAYNPEKPFNSKNFITDFSTASGVDIYSYIIDNTREKKKVNYPETIEQIGYTEEYTDTLIWSFKTRKKYLIVNQKKERLEIALFGSTINKEFKSRKVTVFEINGKPLTWYNYNSLLAPNDGKEFSFKAIANNEIIEFKAKPEQILKEKKHLNWLENSNLESGLAKRFWNR